MLVIQSKNLTITQKLMKLKRKLLIMIMINILLLQNLLSQHQKVLMQDYHNQIQSSLFIGQSYFFNDGAQLYLIFQMLYCTLKRLGDTEKIVERFVSQKNLLLLLLLIIVFLYQLNGSSSFCLVFEISCLKHKNATYTPPNEIICFCFFIFSCFLFIVLLFVLL